MEELDRLIKNGFFQLRYIHDNKAYSFAKRIADSVDDPRDEISPMDALITGAAVSDPECTIFYTMDDQLLTNSDLLNTIAEWRENNGMSSLATRSFLSVIKNKK